MGRPPSEQGTYRSRQVLIFNPTNGALLAEVEQLTTPGGAYAQEKPGFVINYLAVRSAGWTNNQLTPLASAIVTGNGRSSVMVWVNDPV